MIGKEGVSGAVLKKLEHALDHHELVKIKIPADDQEAFRQIVEEVLSAADCQKVQTIGHLLVVFRPSTPPGKVSKALATARLALSRSKLSPKAVAMADDGDHDAPSNEEE